MFKYVCNLLLVELSKYRKVPCMDRVLFDTVAHRYHTCISPYTI